MNSKTDTSSKTVMSLSSIGKKQIMGVTGLMLCGFLLTHMLGNFLIFAGPDSFNRYAHALTSNPLLPLAELILIGIFGTHLILAIVVTR